MAAKKRLRRGRPTRADTAKRVEALLRDAGIDPTEIDPRRILASIAADVSAPASARVQACRALLTKAPSDPEDDDLLTARAIKLMEQLPTTKGRTQ